jgi:hypothetical protein
MEVQAEYLRSSYEELVIVATKIGELYADLAREAYKPFGKRADEGASTR